MDLPGTGAVTRRSVELGDGRLEVLSTSFDGGAGVAPVICAMHPAEAFGAGTVELLAQASARAVVCLDPRGVGFGGEPGRCSLEQMVDDAERARRALGLAPWLFWGMSGGGWLAQLYAHRHREGLAGIVVESACLCFRARLADPTCAISPFFPPWRERLAALGLLRAGSHEDPRPIDDATWLDVAGVGSVLCRPDGAALLVAPAPLSPAMVRALPELWKLDTRAWIGQLRIPALVIAGGADPIVPVARVREVHASLVGSRWLLVEDAGHVPTAARRPEVAGAVRALLAELGAGAGSV